VVDRLDEPLPAGDDLERAVAFLVELDVVRDRLRVTLQVAALAKQFGDLDSSSLAERPAS
jgi:hypothetical protein